MSERLIQLNNLKTHFFIPEGQVRSVNGVSFGIDRGKTLGVLGESGCGKSVTALSIMRLIASPPGRILSGSIEFEGRDLLQLSDEKMRHLRGNELAMIFQEPMTSLNPVYTVGDQIAETFLTHQKISRKEAMREAAEMLHLVGIPEPKKRINEYPHQLSGGMRQRAMIALALACRPKLLIADEPTTALDVTIQAQILDLIMKLQEKFGMAVMMITHDLGVIAEIADDVVVMYAGEVVEYAPIEMLFGNPAHPYTMGLMSSVPKLGQKFRTGKQKLKEIPGMVPNLIQTPRGCLFVPRCPHAMEKCRQEKPPLFILNAAHGTRCWLSEDQSIGRESSPD